MSRWNRDAGPSNAPAWFWQAVETPSSEHRVEVDECEVAYRRWGEPGRRGLLFIHGMNAHSHWWDFIAPQFLDRYRCAAMNLTGMGDSDYRYEYDGDIYAEEIRAVCDDAGFGSNVVLVAHSFGGYMSVRAANLFPERFAGLVLVDSGIRRQFDLIVVAIKKASGEMLYNPASHTQIEIGDTLIALGQKSNLIELSKVLGNRRL